MIRVDIYVYVEVQTDVSLININSFNDRVVADGGTFEAGNCLRSTFESLGGINGIALEAKKLDLFNDEKISINSSIQNVNDISKTFTDFSQTFTIPASKNNNKIFKHWYENSVEDGFSTLIKADAYIELDTMLFRSGKIQLESCNVKDNQPQDYSITFIGALGSLKDKFAGLFLKDLDTDFYDFNYTPTVVKDSIVTNNTSGNIMFPLISSKRYWNYDVVTDAANNINSSSTPIYYGELFPAIKLTAALDMIERDSKFNVNFNGSFLTDSRFANAYLYLKNADDFKAKGQRLKINYQTQSDFIEGFEFNLTTDVLKFTEFDKEDPIRTVSIRTETTVAGIPFKVLVYKNQVLITTVNEVTVIGNTNTGVITNLTTLGSNDAYEFYLSSDIPFTFTSFALLANQYLENDIPINNSVTINQTTPQTTPSVLNVASYFPDIKIEDFFTGILKMFNLTCYSDDGINYRLEQLEEYYNDGKIIDITKHIQTDNVNLNRTKTFKKINFDYEKSDSIINVGFKSANNIEYGSLFYDTGNDGDEYTIKLPFENLNFNNLKDKLQVGYALKSDLQKYTPKPIILYDYNPLGLTNLTDTTFYLSTGTSGSGVGYTSYKAFGQEYFDGQQNYSLNFNEQQSTLTLELVTNSLYNEYYDNYLSNIFNSKARLIKVKGILPTSLLTTLELNDRLIIRDKKYLINTMTTDLTTGEVDFELLTDFRTPPLSPEQLLVNTFQQRVILDSGTFEAKDCLIQKLTEL